jgi:hypothetical protein
MKPTIICKIERTMATVPRTKFLPLVLRSIGPIKGVVYSVPCRTITATNAQATKPSTPAVREVRAAMVIGMDLPKAARAFTDTLDEDMMKFPLSSSVYFFLVLKH